MRDTFKTLLIAGMGATLWACATKPLPDPRMPGMQKDRPVIMTVCFIEDGDAHVAVGDQVEFSNSRLGRLRIRHIPGPDNERGPWNAGESVKVRSAILVERRDPRDDKQDTRRFVPVGRFNVDVAGQPGHQRFDFLTSTATEQLEGNNYPRCNVELGDDEILVRGVEDDARHGGVIHLR
jgi:hypothetical protein